MEDIIYTVDRGATFLLAGTFNLGLIFATASSIANEYCNRRPICVESNFYSETEELYRSYAILAGMSATVMALKGAVKFGFRTFNSKKDNKPSTEEDTEPSEFV